MSSFERRCKAPGCSNISKLRCPDCFKKGQVWSAYCSKDCFSKCWKSHKVFHKVLDDCPLLLQVLTQEERDALEDDMHAGKHSHGIYKGERNSKGQKHGKGTLYWLHGSVHVGEFANDKQNGHGKQTMFNGDCYEGDYKNDQQHGEGVYTWADGGSYSGQFVRDKFHGYGVRVFPSGSRHEGQYEFGKRNGKGILIEYNGDVFNGIFRNDYRESGELTLANGDRYIGKFENEVPHGKGKLIRTDGTVQSGMWIDGTLHSPSSGATTNSSSTSARSKTTSAANMPRQKLLLRDLEIGRTHTGYYIEGTTSKTIRMNGVHTTLTDEKNDMMTVSLYNFPGYSGCFQLSGAQSAHDFMTTSIVKNGVKLRVNDPFCKIAMDGQVVVRVDDWSKVEFDGKQD